MISLQTLSHWFPNHRGAVKLTEEIECVSINSRKSMKKGLFIPIVGERFDGHEFIKDAIDQGAVASLWEKGKEVPGFIPNEFPLFFVDDTTEGLQYTAKKYLKDVHPIVVAITGSNGKTTTKDLFESVLSKKYLTHKTEGNYNNHIGMPLTILSMPRNCELLILEMGMNHFNEISLLSKLSNPDIAVITNIGESHIENLGSREGIAKAKLEIVEGLKKDGLLIIDGDEPLLQQVQLKERTVIRCGENENANNDVVLQNVDFDESGLSFFIPQFDSTYKLNLLGTHNAKNACYAIVAARQLKLTHKQIQLGLDETQLTGMRLEKFPGINDSLLINDAYNASPTSMMAAINVIKELKHYKNKIIVLGDIFELGEQEEYLHRSVAQSITQPISHLITIGKRAKWIANELELIGSNINIQSFNEKEEAIEVIKKNLTKDTVILFKASRAMGFETIVEPCLR